MNLLKDLDDMCLKAMKELIAKGFYFKNDPALQAAISKGSAITEDQKDEVCLCYYNTKARLPGAVCRTVKECKTAVCPVELKKGYDILKKELEEGVDLIPRMSRKVKALDYKDGLWSDWGVYHFHLGVGPDAKHLGMIEGTKLVAYVYLSPNEDTAYIIRVDNHGKWTDCSLLEELLKEYPSAMDQWEIKGVQEISGEYSETGRKELRDRNQNAMMEINGRFYISPWCGVLLNGSSVMARVRLDRDRKFLRGIERLVSKELSVTKPEIVAGLHLEFFKAGHNGCVILKNVAMNIAVVFDGNRLTVYEEAH